MSGNEWREINQTILRLFNAGYYFGGHKAIVMVDVNVYSVSCICVLKSTLNNSNNNNKKSAAHAHSTTNRKKIKTIKLRISIELYLICGKICFAVFVFKLVLTTSHTCLFVFSSSSSFLCALCYCC